MCLWAHFVPGTNRVISCCFREGGRYIITNSSQKLTRRLFVYSNPTFESLFSLTMVEINCIFRSYISFPFEITHTNIYKVYTTWDEKKLKTLFNHVVFELALLITAFLTLRRTLASKYTAASKADTFNAQCSLFSCCYIKEKTSIPLFGKKKKMHPQCLLSIT